MITQRTKVQLLVFVAITLLGVSFVGARYARLDRLFRDDTYTVVAHFADAGGAFVGAEVTYRGVGVGQVQDMQVTPDGVDVSLGIDRAQDTIPADALAVVGNRSAVGEQYVELQPRSDGRPYLRDRSQIAQADTRLPISTTTLLTNLTETVDSLDHDDLRTVVDEAGRAFSGTGPALGRIIDTGNAFIETADANFEVTTALIKDANTVLRTQADSGKELRAFAKSFLAFSTTLADSDKDLRRVIDNGSATANQLRRFLEDNQVDLAELINNLVTTGEVVVKRLPGVEQILVLYPYIVEGGFSVVSKTPSTGLYDAHFGLVLTETPEVCHAGYEGTERRPPQEGENLPMNTEAGCTEPASKSNARGAAHAPPRPAALSQAPTIARYDPATRSLTWGAHVPRAQRPVGSLPPGTLGKETWKWLLLQPMTGPTSGTSRVR